MMRWIISTSLKLKYLVVLAGALLMFFGTMQVRDMPIDAFPEFAPPRVEIQTVALGNSSDEVEQLITVPIENELGGLEGLAEMRSKPVAPCPRSS